MASTQIINLGIAAGTNVVCVYLCVTMFYWARHAGHATTGQRLRLLLLSNAVIKFAVWLWTLFLMGQIVLFDFDPRLTTIPGRAAIFLSVGFQAWVVSKVKPAPLIDGL